MANASQDVNSYLLPTLERFRNKLLDLTARNNLLNLALNSTRTTRLLRFVACDPQAVLQTLCSGNSLELTALPDPPEDDEKALDGEEFHTALAHARDEDPLYRQILADSAGDTELSPALAQAEDRLRTLTRRELAKGGKDVRANRNMARWAETQGINPDFELPIATGASSKHKGGLQVLQLAPRLERLAEAIRKLARSSIEETGNNILYLAFGCLEWSEKNRSFFAPLILLPVELNKSTTRGGAKSFSLKGTDDAPMGNITLKERLRRDFLIDFPLPETSEDGVDLKAYFDRVAAAVAEVEGWEVRSYQNLSLLNFSGLGLYEDLDPHKVCSSPLVKQLLAAELADEEEESGAEVVAEDVHVDQASVAGRVPILITQADASQFAAIADVMAGRSMVIEGPPGTGKSQTITNIIANALYAGKRVLFVAEKKVALDVVYTRLAEAGLKPYCLRVASDKANKREVYDELAERLLLPRPRAPRRDASLGDFNQLRDQLNSFSELLNNGHGAEEESHHNLLWAELKLRQELLAAGLDLADHQVALPAATAYTYPQVEQVAQIYDQLADLASSVDLEELGGTFAALGARPGDALGRDQLMEQAKGWAEALAAMSKLVDQTAELSGRSLQALRKLAREGAVSASRLPDPLPVEQESLLPLLSSAEVSGIAQGLLRALRAEQASAKHLGSILVRIPDPLPDPVRFSDFVARWTQWTLGHLQMPSTARDRQHLNERLAHIADRAERVQVACDAAGVDLAVDQGSHAAVRALAAVLEHLSALPGWVLQQRDQTLWTADSERLRDLLARYASLQAQKESLGLTTSPLPQPWSTSELSQAATLLDRCCERGMAAVLPNPSAAEQWGAQVSAAQALLDRTARALEHGIAGHSLDNFTLEQLQALPTVLRSVAALSPNALNHRGSHLWDASLEAIASTLHAEADLERTRNELERDGLGVPDAVTAQQLRDAAASLESRKGLHKLVSSVAGSYGRATRLAKKVGAEDASQRPRALRRVAEVLDLQSSFPASQVSIWCSEGLNLREAAAVARELDGLKMFLISKASTAGFLVLARTIPLDDVHTLLSIFEGGLAGDLDALVSHPLWADTTAEGMTLAALRSQLETSHRDQSLLEQATPYAARALAAGMSDGAGMAGWFRDVLQLWEVDARFPHLEFEAMVGQSPDLPRAQVVVEAAAEHKALLSVAGWADLGPLLQTITKPELERLSLLIGRQLIPQLDQLLADGDLFPSGGEHQPIGELLASMNHAIAGYRQLLQEWAVLGLQDGLTTAALLEVPIELEFHSRRQAEVLRASEDLHQQAGPVLAGTPPETLRAVMAWIAQLRELRLPLAMEQRCLAERSAQYITTQRVQGAALASAVEREEAAAEQFSALAALSPEQLGGEFVNLVEALPHEVMAAWLGRLLTLREAFPLWVRFHQLMDSLPGAAHRRLLEALMTANVPPTHWRSIYRWNLVRSKLVEISEASPATKSIRASEQVARRERFHRTEAQLMELDRAEVIAHIHRDPAELPVGINRGPRGEFTEMALIANETPKQKRHRPLRHLFQDAGNALRGLKPCWMMSPSTVASLVPREAIEQFDLVIVDEASQMPPERAFGVLSRAKQCVVVGDPKQLPPTTFFQRSTSSEDGEQVEDVDTEALDEESILDLCTKSFQPVRRLKWHYRSRHGSLIAFSNRNFYNSQLVVFPSCDRDFAIRRHLVEAPRYVRSVNLPEVKVLCDVVLEQLELHPERSLGVVAMNESQSEEIAEQLETLSIHHEELRRRLDLSDSSEELFVKSLEKVQGDERDTIVISTTYGPAEPGGPVAMRFGPINQNGGHRRLNVLFTRAKHRIELVTSMESSQIHPTATSSQGVHALKGYLKFVETQSLETGRQSGRPPDSDFEIVVSEALERHGFRVDCQVGVANYFIDLAVCHPDHPDRYLLGVECDGATYHSARAARDRDKYRQAVLENLGWQIYRIWSTDWFENAEAETRKLVGYLEALLSRRADHQQP